MLASVALYDKSLDYADKIASSMLSSLLRCLPVRKITLQQFPLLDWRFEKEITEPASICNTETCLKTLMF